MSSNYIDDDDSCFRTTLSEQVSRKASITASLILRALRWYHLALLRWLKESRMKMMCCNNVSASVPVKRFSKSTSGKYGHQESDTVTKVLCGVDDIGNGEMKNFTVGDRNVLLVKDDDKFYAIGGRCTHYGASLASGVYANGHVRCPWHGARFCVKNGDIEDFPGMDSLPHFQVTVKEGNVILVAERAQLENAKRVRFEPTDVIVEIQQPELDPVVIVGGGPAALSCAETLRYEGFTGRILMLASENFLPYDRTKLSKVPNTSPKDLMLRSDDFLNEHQIEFHGNCKIISVNTREKCVTQKGGGSHSYYKLVLATGCKPTKLKCSGATLTGVYYLTDPNSGNAVANAISGKHILVVGCTLTGLEIAAYAAFTLSKKAKSVTVVGNSKQICQLLGKQLFAALKILFESKRVALRTDTELERLHGKDAVSGAIFTDGTSLGNIQTVIVTQDVQPCTDYLYDFQGIAMDKQKYVKVDANMKTTAAHVYAAGDMVLFPLKLFNQQQANIKCWQLALKQGQTAAFSIMDNSRPISTVPFFWTAFFGKSIRYTGYAPDFDECMIHGSLEKMEFVAYYIKSNVVNAVATFDRDPICATFAELLIAGQTVTKEHVIENPSADWMPLLKAASKLQGGANKEEKRQ